MVKIDTIKALSELKKRYVTDKVSLLVGSGFSKNVWYEFPLWDQLLTDMTQELYKLEAKEAIRKYGYLRIVSEYIKLKGMRESIEDYIEHRIPYMEKGQFLLKFVGRDSIPVNKSDFELHKQLLSSRWEKIYTTNYDDLLEFTADIFDLKWKAISSADNLTLNNETNNLIVKLHGTIYHQDSEKNYTFEFDGNHHHRYIISQEDYDNYPKEHEAFTQLMKISLLQGTFCLIGFSGNDPNYLSWINWVRDVLIRSSREYDIKNAKVFLIDVSGEEPTTDRQLFYVNHHIIHISLRDKDVLKIFGIENNPNIQNKELINKFLAYLNHDDILAQELNVTSKEVYNALWRRSMRVVDKQMQVSSSDVKDIQDRMTNNRVVTQASSQIYFLSSILKKSTFSKDEITLILIALRDTGLPFSYYPNLKERLKTDLITDWQKKLFQELEYREFTLYNSKLDFVFTDDKTTYEHILHTAFQLNFKELFVLIQSWKPQTYYIFTKAIWMSLFDIKVHRELLKDYKENSPNLQEEYWAIELLRMSARPDTPFTSIIKYENLGLVSLYAVRDKILKQLSTKQKKIEPYGQSTTFVNIDNSNIDYERAMKAIQYIIDFPCLPSIGIISMIPSDKWYKIFKQIYEEHPYPALFYSLSVHDRDVQQRIGQDLSYSDKLYAQGVTNEMVINLFKCILDEKTPENYKRGSFTILRELLYSVKTSEWEANFVHVWNNLFLADIKNADTKRELIQLIYRAVSLLKTDSIIETIIKDCLVSYKANRSIIIVVLYYIPKYDNKKLTIKLNQEINDFIENIDDVDDVQILGNIFVYLTDEHIQKVCNKLLSLNNGTIIIENHINALCHFAKHNTILMNALKKAILFSKRLWDNGILDNDAFTHAYCLHITQFDKILNWTDEELIQLYEKLKDSVNEVFRSIQYKENNSLFRIFGTADDLLEEMYVFLSTYHTRLEYLKDFNESYLKIKKELNSIQGFTDIENGLLSDDSNIVTKAIKSLIYNIKINPESFPERLIELIADRILFNKREGFEQSLQVLSYFIKAYYNEKQMPNSLKHKILLILERNDRSILMRSDYDLIAVLHNFIILAQSMEDLGIKSCITKKWIDLGKSERFNLQCID